MNTQKYKKEIEYNYREPKDNNCILFILYNANSNVGSTKTGSNTIASTKLKIIILFGAKKINAVLA